MQCEDVYRLSVEYITRRQWLGLNRMSRLLERQWTEENMKKGVAAYIKLLLMQLAGFTK
jgi:hypothetical protein